MEKIERVAVRLHQVFTDKNDARLARARWRMRGLEASLVELSDGRYRVTRIEHRLKA